MESTGPCRQLRLLEKVSNWQFSHHNRFTLLDAHPLLSNENLVNEVALDKFYSSLDLRSAYNQIALLPEEKQYTAFEAGGELLQFERFPFGVTNGTSAFQRTIDNFIKRYNLKKLHAYLDDITVTSSTMEDHDLNLKRPLTPLMHDTEWGEVEIELDHHWHARLSHLPNETKPYPKRLQPLLDLPLLLLWKSWK